MSSKLEYFMKQAIDLAQKAYNLNDIPIGAVVVKNEKIIGKGYNQVKLLNDPTAHAEIIAITSAANTIKNWQLKDCEIFTTLEPCIMCSGAIINSRIKNIYFGAYDKKFGGCSSLYNICNDPRLKHRCGIKGGIMEIDCKWIIDDFFQKLRK
ncbi:MAG: tRNA adenosine(34) deaminase TadA [Candidatus Neomarinimicrobiota bacterium]|nr:tRNA adenosine(34) deaminase TadA [Candidatus Neomarinimicrobiota bacterium]